MHLSARTLLPVAASLGLLLVVGALFGPVMGYEFVRWDDDINVTQNPVLTAPWTVELWGQLIDARQAMRFKPLHSLMGRGVYAGWGFSPGAWHAVNLLFHVGVTLLVFHTLRRMARRGAVAPEGPATVVVLAVITALWAIHPLRAEPVAWVTGSTYPFTTFWLVGAFYCYLRAHEARPGSGRWWLGAAVVAALAAYASYPVSVTFGLWLLVVDGWWLRIAPNRGASRITWARWGGKHACFLIPAIASVAVTVWTRFADPGIFGAAPDTATVGFGLRGVMAGASVAYLALSAFWPLHLTPNVPPLIWDGDVLATVLGLAVLSLLAVVLAWRMRRTRPGWWVAVAGFGLLSLPCLGLTEHPTWPVDRYTYLTQLVLFGGIGLALVQTRPWARGSGWRWASGLAAALAMVACAGATRAQLATWQDSERLFTAMEAHPGFAKNPRQQGHVYFLWARYEATAGHPVRAEELYRASQQVYLDAIRAALHRTNWVEALSLMSHFEQHFTATPVMHREKGFWLLQLGRWAEGRTELAAAAAAMPDDARTRELVAAAAARAQLMP